MESEKAELERQLEGLREGQSVPSNGTSKKRKKADDEPVVNTRAAKKKQKVENDEKEEYRAFLEDLNTGCSPASGDIGLFLLPFRGILYLTRELPDQEFLRSFVSLFKVLKDPDRSDSTALASYTTRAASAIPPILAKALQQASPNDEAGIEQLRRACNASSRAFSLLVCGTKELARKSQDAVSQGHTIYPIVQMFSKLTSLLSDVASARAKDISTTHSPAKSQAKARRAKTSQARDSQGKDDPGVCLLTHTLGRMIDMLDPKLETHRSIFEGFSCTLLESIGPVLYTLVFGHPRAPTLQEEMSMLVEASESGALSERNARQIEVRAASLQAPFLVHLLRQIMKLAPDHFGAESTSTTSRSKQAGTKGPAKGALTIAAKERLQRTLVKFCFGNEGVDESDPFFDCLTKPLQPDPPVAMPKVDESEVSEWFTEEVWSVLGWDILAREGD